MECCLSEYIPGSGNEFSSGNKNADIESFLEWWETTGKKKSIVLPANQNAARISHNS